MVIMMIESDNRATYQKKASSFFLVLGLRDRDHNMISDLQILQMHVLNHSWSYETRNNFKQSNFFS